MKIEKTWVSYPLWFLYAVWVGVLSAVYAAAISRQVWHLNPYLTAALVALLFGAVGGVWFAGHKAAAYLNGRFAGDKHLADMWECFMVMGLTAAALLYRFRLILHAEVPVEVGGWYENAVVKAGEGVVWTPHGASHLYTLLLSVVLSFTGNRVIAGVFLQLFLEIAAMLLLYTGVRCLTGRIEAVCVLAVLTFSSTFGAELFRLMPEVLYLLLYAGGVALLGICAKSDAKRRMVCLIFAGAYIGWLAYLDPAGWTLLLLGIWVCLGKKAASEEGKKSWQRVLLLGIAAGLGMLVSCIIAAISGGQRISAVLASWMSTYAEAGKLRFPSGPDENIMLGIMVCFLAALSVVGFWVQKRHKQDGWILLLAAFSVLDMSGVGILQYEIFLTAVWGVLAGTGITSMRAETAVPMWEEIPEEALPAKELVVEEITLEEEAPKVQLIENPLPLPKKHVKKEMDFDHEVDENDDFDI